MKSLKAKKAALTREIKLTEEYVKDLREAISKHDGWYLGDKITHYRLSKEELSLELMKVRRRLMDLKIKQNIF